MNRWRTSICKISMHTKTKLAWLETKNANMLEKMRQKDLQFMRRDTDRKLMLDALQIEATRSWPTLSNLEQKVNTDVVLP